MGWIYYRVFAKNVEHWYFKILNEVARPFFQANMKSIEKLFFFHYIEPYKFDRKCEPLKMFAIGEEVRYVRMRFLVANNEILRLHKDLVSLIDASPTVLGKEECEYEPREDLGNRFGQERLELSIGYLDSFARMMLSMLTKDGELEDTEKPHGMIHLLHNMMGGPNFKFDLKCGNCGFLNKATAISAIECSRCSYINFF